MLNARRMAASKLIQFTKQQRAARCCNKIRRLYLMRLKGTTESGIILRPGREFWLMGDKTLRYIQILHSWVGGCVLG